MSSQFTEQGGTPLTTLRNQEAARENRSLELASLNPQLLRDPSVVSGIQDGRKSYFFGPRITAPLISVTGVSTGDEGKGRTVLDILRPLMAMSGRDNPIAMVVKANGGANSGHTAANLKHNLIPVGITEESIDYLALGRGVVADPRKLLWEILPLEERGYRVRDRLRIDHRTMVSDLTDRLLDLADEAYRARMTGVSRGSTGRGITPAFRREVSHKQLYYHIFCDGTFECLRGVFAQHAEECCRTIEQMYRLTPDEWDGLFETLSTAEGKALREAIDSGVLDKSECDFHRFKGSAPFTLNIDELARAYWEAGSKIAGCITDVSELALNCIDAGRHVVGEHGQAYWLDKRHGFSPSVTASHTYTPELYQSLNIPVTTPVHIIGVAKAYDTKVGTHRFLTEIEPDHPLGEILREIEFGTTTGRQRMVGWFDAVEKGHVLRHGGYQDLVINKLDVLTLQGEWCGPLKICVAYQDAEGHRYYKVPYSDVIRAQLSPVYETLPGWSGSLSEVRHFEDLPYHAQRYVAVMYRAVVNVAHHGRSGAPGLPHLRFIGVGPDPDQIIFDVPEGEALLQLACG